MKAFSIIHAGASPRLTQRPDRAPKSDEIKVRIAAAGLNFADLLMIEGTYQDTPAPPFTLGLEAAGEVIEVGSDVDRFSVGDRVSVYCGQGGLAESGCFAASRAVLLPDEVTYDVGASFQIAYGTSHLALAHRARLRRGETLLVLGAAGGVGLTAVEIGKLMGARVIACARGPEKLNIARMAGADHLIEADTQDIRTSVKDLGGADVVYDPVGGDQFMSAFRACNPEARILSIGFAGGQVPQPRLNHLLVKNIDILGFYWGGYLSFAPEKLTNSLAKVLEWLAEGRLAPHISAVLPFDRVEDGLDLLRQRKNTGKVVIRISD
ncbi:NADPH2:quinone reductase [Poseidonocella pacifica]|uniref:NADPH2:quinone reductase n=1 Tax=Poseidonocella pacifica TaxID=871651 RepID=A0A1I0WAV8_9RHOB|nr:NADPH:quinone oxidoreductase family protein [Poseidonocella pacifica]SFA85497.1 NADPH2:quinone reductase [Poseidonocella pacifica]